MSFHNELVFTEAKEQVERILEASDPDEVATRIEQIASLGPDMCMSAMMIFYFKAKKLAEGVSGVELANSNPPARLYLPPGVNP